MQRAVPSVLAAVVLPLVAACAGGSSADDAVALDGSAGGGDDAATAASVPDAADATTASDTGGVDAVADGGDAVAATDAPADSPGVDAADAAPGTTVVGCAPGSQSVTMTNGNVTVAYDLSTGLATFSYAALPKVTAFYAGVQLKTYVTSRGYATHACATSGSVTTITSTGNGLPTMTQTFTLPGGNHFLTQVSVSVSGSGLSSSWMGPVVVDSSGSVDVGSNGDPRLLWVPFDNDNFVRYNAAPLPNNSGTSFEAAAFYDNANRHGVVVGSVTHDTWKTGIYYHSGASKLDAMNVFGGANDATYGHDVVPHGAVAGATIASPVAFVGYSADWRDLFEEYADANLAYAPRMAWSGGVPFGWNSWGKVQTALTYAKAVAVSDYLHATLQPAGFANDGTVYVNLDSYWDNLSSTELTNFVAHAHANGQKAGIYWTPWVDWGKSASRVVEGTTTTYDKIWLKDTKGNPIQLDGAFAVDPTHPVTKARVDYFVNEFKSWGFDYVKLDFLTHGALESTVRYDPAVTTGIGAYNQGMQYLVSKIGGSMFISESIAPLFPYRYAHARRVSCDTFGAATGANASVEYEMNSAAYGWWMSGKLYSFNDPDQLVFQGFTAQDNRMRLASGVVSGTLMLDGDDLSSADGQTAALANLGNPRLDALARLGKAFRPLDGASGASATDVLTMENAGVHYVALFNYGGSAVTRGVDLGRAGLDPTKTYGVVDLETGAQSTATGTLSVALQATDAKIVALQ